MELALTPFAHRKPGPFFEIPFQEGIRIPAAACSDQGNRARRASQEAEHLLKTDLQDPFADGGSGNVPEPLFCEAARVWDFLQHVFGCQSFAGIAHDPFQGVPDMVVVRMKQERRTAADGFGWAVVERFAGRIRVVELFCQQFDCHSTRTEVVGADGGNRRRAAFATEDVVIDAQDGNRVGAFDAGVETRNDDLFGRFVVGGENAAWFRERFQPSDQFLLEGNDIVAEPGIFEAVELFVRFDLRQLIAKGVIAQTGPIGAAAPADVSIASGVELAEFVGGDLGILFGVDANGKDSGLILEQAQIGINKDNGNGSVGFVFDGHAQVGAFHDYAIGLPVIDEFFRRVVGTTVFHLDDPPVVQFRLFPDPGQFHLVATGMQVGEKKNGFHGLCKQRKKEKA